MALTTSGQFRYPTFLPDGRHFLYTDIRQQSETSGIHVASLDSAEDHRILGDRSAAVFAPSYPGSRAGHLLFVRENNLMAVSFDAVTSQTSSDAFAVAEVSISLRNAGYVPVTVSETGMLLFESGGPAQGSNQLVWYDRTGKVLGPFGASGNVFSPAISPDEKTVAYTRTSGGSGGDIWLRNLARPNETRLTVSSLNFSVSWSPKSDRVLFTSGGAAFGGLYMQAVSAFFFVPSRLRGYPLILSSFTRFPPRIASF